MTRKSVELRPLPHLTAAIRVRVEPELRLELERRAIALDIPASALARRLIRNGLAELGEGKGR